MNTEALPGETVASRLSTPSERSCTSCGIPMIIRESAPPPLCSQCRARTQTDISRRSAELRTCLRVLQSSPAHAEDVYVAARDHLLVLAEYEREGIVRVTPTSATILERLDAQRRSRLPRDGAPDPDGRVRDHRPLIDWVAESARLERAHSSGPLRRAQTERRTQLRRRASFLVRVHPFGVNARAKNVSADGIYIECRADKTVGTPVRLTLASENGPIVTQGIIRRVDRAKSGPTSETSGLAIQFTKVPPTFSLDSLL